jgi:MFS family permease
VTTAGAAAGQGDVPGEEGSALDEPVDRVSRSWTTKIALANLGLFMAYFGPLGVLLPNQVQAIAGAHRVIAFSWVTGLGAVVAMVVNPLAGALSDRTTSRFGRRRPWIAGGAVGTAAALLLVGRMQSIPWIVVAWCLTQVAVNSMQAGLAACVPDRVPVSQRGAVSGWIGIASTAAVVVAAALVTTVGGRWAYLLLAVIVVVSAAPYVFSTTDRPLLRTGEPEFRRPAPGRFSRRRRAWSHDFGWAWLTRFLMVLGNALAVVYLLYFLRRIGFSKIFPGHPAEDGLVILLTVYTLAVTATTVIAGRNSDRTGHRRRPVAIAGAVMAVAALLLAVRPTWPALLISALILGIGFGVYLSVDQALVTQVLPSAAGRAKDLGVISVASSAGQAMAPAIAAPLVTYLGGFTALYLCVAVVVLLGSASVQRIRSMP